ncbi:hypothetical protein PanWU01x14_139840 [Parasponia andersonii]|uniref:Uncharacterized protein n=1 Tax=Parasponia andersonii TaxID=3476 RepID=A0A2P5CMM6_PARAD|nr:hypothetical protein PanWU01x14_139840 [Parasponia andersonii]
MTKNATDDVCRLLYREDNSDQVTPIVSLQRYTKCGTYCEEAGTCSNYLSYVCTMVVSTAVKEYKLLTMIPRKPP